MGLDDQKNSSFSEELCFQYARKLGEYWAQHPSVFYSSIDYDSAHRIFVLKHKKDGRVEVTPQRFFELVVTKIIALMRNRFEEFL
jgi:hypothetical protein